MSEKFDYFKFQNVVNPFGILFHPIAIEKFIGFAANQKQFTTDGIFFHNERWHCFDAHSDLSHSDSAQLLQNLNLIVAETHSQLLKASHLIITFGTAWVYRKSDSETIVANCHKVPQKQFLKELLSVEMIQKSIQNTISLLQQINPKLQIIFTISPVRHIKDGFVENTWSKSNLITAVHQVVHQRSENLHYFPSYEIMMDELRDYRFYGEDMIHPNKTAVDYIWKRFSETWICESAQSIMEKIQNIQKGLLHRPFHPESESHQLFMAQLQADISTLQKQLPHLYF